MFTLEGKVKRAIPLLDGKKRHFLYIEIADPYKRAYDCQLSEEESVYKDFIEIKEGIHSLSKEIKDHNIKVIVEDISCNGPHVNCQITSIQDLDPYHDQTKTTEEPEQKVNNTDKRLDTLEQHLSKHTTLLAQILERLNEK